MSYDLYCPCYPSSLGYLLYSWLHVSHSICLCSMGSFCHPSLLLGGQSHWVMLRPGQQMWSWWEHLLMVIGHVRDLEFACHVFHHVLAPFSGHMWHGVPYWQIWSICPSDMTAQILQWNGQGIIGKWAEMKQMLVEETLQVICLQETHFVKHDTYSHLTYHTFHCTVHILHREKGEVVCPFMLSVFFPIWKSTYKAPCRLWLV